METIRSPDRPRPRWTGLLCALVAAALHPAGWAQERLDIDAGAGVLVIGNTFAERVAQSGYLDLAIHASHPDGRLRVRQVPWSADSVSARPREVNVPTNEHHLDALDPDVVFMCYGMVESFEGLEGLEGFSRDLRGYVEDVATRGRNGAEPRTVVLVSPIAHEDLGAPMVTGTALTARNADLAAYVEQMRREAARTGARFVDLFTPSLSAGGALTSNGIHPNELGAFAYAGEIARQLGWRAGADDAVSATDAASIEQLRLIAGDKHYHERLAYRPTNTEYVWGRRHEPFGAVNFPPETAQLERMIAARDRLLWTLPKPSPEALFAMRPAGTSLWEQMPADLDLPEDGWTPPPVEAKGTETSLGSLEIPEPDAFRASFTLADGYRIDAFASERDFPELASPLAMTFDERGRLWVLCAPTYPHLLPGAEPRCKLVTLADTDGDGRADALTVFADRLYVPTGMAIDAVGPGGVVYVGQAPDLLRLTDDDGDGVADRREIVLSGFGMPDSHHQISAFEWDPAGGFLMHEGVFTISGVETAWGVRRTRDAAVWRYDPRDQRLDVMSHASFSNPWGHAFDDFGQSILADASGGANYSFAHVIAPFQYPRKPGKPGQVLNRGRPTAGAELISSRHFPPDVQDTFLVNQSIGFHGTRWDRLIPDGSGYRHERLAQDLIACADTNFRPVAMEIGPDGALYVLDWCNPIIGHMQYSVRDPRRDSSHGRVWRVTHRSRPLVDPPDLAGASVEQLLAHLRLPERNTRRLARHRLQRADPSAVLPRLDAWSGGLSPLDPMRDRLLVEALWIRQAMGRVEPELLDRVLRLPDPRARAAGVRAVRHLLVADRLEPRAAARQVERAIDDGHALVRLEGVLASGFLEAEVGERLVERAAGHAMDEPLYVLVRETLIHLGRGRASRSPLVRRLRYEQMSVAALLDEPLDDVVASVVVMRSDADPGQRRRALEVLAGAEPGAQAAALLEQLGAVRRGPQAASIAELLVALPAPALRSHVGRLRALARSTDAHERRVALAALMAADEAHPAISAADDPSLVGAVALLEPGAAPARVLERVRAGVESGSVDARAGASQLARHETSRDQTSQDALFRWLAGLVDAVSDRSAARWSRQHDTAMAALGVMHRIEAWPAGYDAYRIDVASEARMSIGARIYHDEVVGCARCHGSDGRGLEGFPPLDRSPWLLGDPRRGASIVVHGLSGRLAMPDGSAYDSAMAPLGASLDDQQVADVLTYARQSWGNFAPPVRAEHVASARSRLPTTGLWQVGALAAAYPLERDTLLGTLDRAAGAAPPGDVKGVFVAALALYLGPLAIVLGVLVLLARRSDR